MALSPTQMRLYFARGLFGAGDAAMMLAKLGADAGLSPAPGQRYIVACLIQCALDAMDDHNARLAQGLGPIDRPNERDRARDDARRNEQPVKPMNPKKKPAPPAPPPPPVAVDDEADDMTPAEVVQELRDELATMKEHTGNHHTDKLVVLFDRLLESMQEGAPDSDD